jgi:capsular polysaccharide biosynthesis protein
MELQDYVRILKRRGWIIILLMVMTAAAAFAFSKLQTEIFKSSVEILIQPARADFGLTQSAKWLLRSYVAWLDTDTRAQEVIDLLSLDRLPGDLRSDVKIASDESRFVIQIDVEDPDGDLANDVAQAWTDLFLQWRNEVNAKQRKEDRVEAVQLDPPRYGLARPKWKVNVLAGAILGALVGGAVVFILEWVESGVVRRPEDIERYLELPLLGTIPSPKLDTSRPYLLRGKSTRSASIPAAPLVQPDVARPEPVSLPQFVPAPYQPQPPVKGPAPLATTPSEAETTPALDTAPIVPPAPSPGEEQVGPIEPTILLSKGDKLS